jgi:hypothetical protein
VYNAFTLVLFDCHDNDSITFANIGISFTHFYLSILIRKNFPAAELIYRTFKFKTYSNQTRLFNDGFLQDLIDLEAAGIISPANPEIYQEVTKIKIMLKSK